jgi:hypothetical protein
VDAREHRFRLIRLAMLRSDCEPLLSGVFGVPDNR